MLKYLQLAFAGIVLSACAAGPEANTPVDGVSEAKVAEDVSQNEKTNIKDDKPNRILAENEAGVMTFWQKQPGTSVYNSEGEVVGNLRLRPTVIVYEVKEAWSRVHVEKDEWVKTSDLSHEKPKGVLPKPVESNGLDRIDREALKKAVETGVRPGEEK